jgi:hypothetical protein
MPECEGLMEPRRILFGSSAFRIKLLKSFQEEIFLIKLSRKHCFMLSAWLLMNLPPVADRFASQFSAKGGLALYTGRNFERPFISHSVQPKIGHLSTQVKLFRSISIHK